MHTDNSKHLRIYHHPKIHNIPQKNQRFKGNIIKAGESSPYSLYNESLASFTTGDLYDHHDADGFITLFGLPLKVRAMKMQELEKNNNK